MRFARSGSLIAAVFTLLFVIASSLDLVPAGARTGSQSSRNGYRQLVSGIGIRRFSLPGPVRGLALRVDLTRIAIRPVTATGDAHGYGTLRAVAARHHGLVAVNGDLAFGSGPAHLLVSGGRLVAVGQQGGAAFALDRAGRRVVAAAGRPFAVLRGVRSKIPVVEGAFGGYPALVHRGRTQSMRCGPLTCALHPRTAVGITRGCPDDSWSTPCRMLIVVVDGRRLGWSVGITTEDLASFMVRLGAYEAINLDGGASTQALFRGRSLNRVAPGARRAVVSALILRRRPTELPAPSLPLCVWKRLPVVS